MLFIINLHCRQFSIRFFQLLKNSFVIPSLRLSARGWPGQVRAELRVCDEAGARRRVHLRRLQHQPHGPQPRHRHAQTQV